jgi:hypothetical protein
LTESTPSGFRSGLFAKRFPNRRRSRSLFSREEGFQQGSIAPWCSAHFWAAGECHARHAFFFFLVLAHPLQSVMLVLLLAIAALAPVVTAQNYNVRGFCAFGALELTVESDRRGPFGT